MSGKKYLVAALVAVMVIGAGVAVAQTTTNLEIKRGTVVSVWGNHLVVKMANGTIKEAEVPEDFMFNVEGKDLPISALKPGMQLTALVKTYTTPTEVNTTEVKEGTVLAASGRTVIIRGPEGVKKYVVPKDFPFWVNGEKKTVYDLRKGQKVTAEIVHTSVEVITEQDVQVAAQKLAETKPAPRPKRVAKPAAPAAPTLPKTGSSLPLAGLAGVVLLLLSFGIAIVRRF